MSPTAISTARCAIAEWGGGENLNEADREFPARLVVIRGNSASGKSAVAAEIRRRHGRGLAIVGQDNLRRQVLRERDVPRGANIGLIDLTARFALDRGFHVIVEGIFFLALALPASSLRRALGRRGRCQGRRAG
jgi:hypothetical protein